MHTWIEHSVAQMYIGYLKYLLRGLSDSWHLIENVPKMGVGGEDMIEYSLAQIEELIGDGDLAHVMILRIWLPDTDINQRRSRSIPLVFAMGKRYMSI